MFAILQRLDSASLKALFGNFAESRSKGFDEAIYENEYAEDYGYLSDSDLEDEKPPFARKQVKVSSAHPFPTLGEDKLVHEKIEGRVWKGKVVKIPDVVFVT